MSRSESPTFENLRGVGDEGAAARMAGALIALITQKAIK
jgi:hypothetical protein